MRSLRIIFFVFLAISGNSFYTISMSLVLYPLLLLKFWYVEAPLGLLKFFIYLNIYILHLLSIPLFLNTFFKPAKLEYRKGLIGFSIMFGIISKSFFLFADFFLFIPILIVEVVFFLAFLAYPLMPFYILLR